MLETLPYEPPRVEAVLTPEDLTREILYAGQASLCEPDCETG
jgi:hypothetical protein